MSSEAEQQHGMTGEGGAGTGAATWEPRPTEATDTVPEGTAVALHGLLDAPGAAPAAGEPLPPLWHWLTFVPRVPQREIDVDGHPRRGSFMPPVDLPRRMFAGARLDFHAPARVDAPLHRRSTVESVEEKTGRSGALVFVTVRHEVSAGEGLALTEEQDIVYREATPGGPPRPRRDDEPALDGAWDWAWDLPIDPVVLFRFSALTYNAHRIHYDRPYATEVEGYPGLVVHGPLQAVALAELCRRHDERPLRTFSFRGLRAAYDDGPLHLRGRLADDGQRAQLVAFDAHGNPTMSAQAALP